MNESFDYCINILVDLSATVANTAVSVFAILRNALHQ